MADFVTEISSMGHLAHVFFFCSHGLMERIDPARLASALLSTPAWARLGLAVRNEQLRSRAANAVVAELLAEMGLALPETDPRQLALPDLQEPMDETREDRHRRRQASRSR